MNISKQQMSGKCDEKCSYSFQYSTTANTNAKNFGSFISLTYDKATTPPVLFNSLKYDVASIELYSPSMHTFTNGPADGEIIILHTSSQSGAPLLVCIPIMSSGVAAGNGSVILEKIVDAIVAKPLLQYQDAMSVPVNNFSLNSIVPKAPFFFYESAKDKANIVVYDVGNAIYCTTSKVNNLRALFSIPVTNPLQPGDDLYYNSSGPKLSSIMDDSIYIDCSPTGSSTETVDVTFKNPDSNDLINAYTAPIFVLFCATIGFVILLIIAYTIFKFIVGDKIDNAFINRIQDSLKSDGIKTIKENSLFKSTKQLLEDTGKQIRYRSTTLKQAQTYDK